MAWTVLYENVTHGGIVFTNDHSGILELPAESEILSAYLVWQGEQGQSLATLVTSEGGFPLESQRIHEGFHFAEVTAIVRKSGCGPYHLKNQSGRTGQWTLCAAYHSVTQPMRKLAILLPSCEGEGALISGFFTPIYGPLEGKLLVGLNRVSGELTNQPITFQGRRMERNSLDPTRSWQVSAFDLSTFLLNAQSSCSLYGKGVSRDFSAHLIGLQIRVHAPFFAVNPQIEPSVLKVGEVVTCKLTIFNQGTSVNEHMEAELNLPEELELDTEGLQGGEWIDGKVLIGKVLPGKSVQVIFSARLAKKPNLPDFEWRPAVRFSFRSFDQQITNQCILSRPFVVQIANRPPVALPLQAIVRENEKFCGCVKGLDFDGDPLFYALQQEPQHGSLTFAEDGQFVYLPREGYFGEDRFVYTVRDPFGGTSEGTVLIQVLPQISSIPSEILVETKENEPIEVPVPFYTNFPCKCLVEPSYGMVDWHEDGKFIYTPIRNYTGEDGMLLFWKDSAGETAYTHVKIKVNRRQRSPIFLPQMLSTYQNTSIETKVKVIHDRACTFELVVPPANGTIELKEDATLCYNPHPQFYGKDSFTLKASDDAGGSAEAEYLVEVAELPNSNVSVIEVETEPNQPGSGILPGDFTQMEFAPQNGTLEINENKEFVYSPFASFTGQDFCILSCRHPSGVKDYVVIQISVRPRPVVLDQTFTTISGMPFSGRIFAVHPQNKPLIELVEPASFGSVTVKEDGSFLYQSDSAFVGEDAFVIRIGGLHKRIPIQVVAREEEPLTKELICQVEEGSTLREKIQLLPPYRGSFSLVSEPRYGDVDLQADGTFTYVSRSLGQGRDFFAYQVITEEGKSAIGAVEFHLLPNKEKSRLREEFSWSTHKNRPLHRKLPILFSSEFSRFELKKRPINGTVTLNEDGSFTYIPAHDSVGKDFFVVHVNEEQEITVWIEVKEEPQKQKMEDLCLQTPKNTPVTEQVWKNEGKSEIQWKLSQAPLFGNVMITAYGSFTYVPSQDFLGSDYFAIEGMYRDGSTEIVVVSIEVIPQEQSALAVASREQSVDEPEQSFEDLFIVEEESVPELDLQYVMKEQKRKIQRKLPLPAGYQFAICEQPKFGRVEIFADGRFLYRKAKQRKAKADEFVVKASKTEDLLIRVRIQFR